MITYKSNKQCATNKQTSATNEKPQALKTNEQVQQMKNHNKRTSATNEQSQPTNKSNSIQSRQPTSLETSTFYRSFTLTIGYNFCGQTQPTKFFALDQESLASVCVFNVYTFIPYSKRWSTPKSMKAKTSWIKLDSLLLILFDPSSE